MISINFKEIIDLYENELKGLSNKKKEKLDNEIKNLSDNEISVLNDYEQFFKNLLNKYSYVKYIDFLKKEKLKYHEINIDTIENYLKKVKKYKIIKNLGQGAFGTVFLVEKNKNQFAVKIQFFYSQQINDANIKSFIDESINEYKNGKVTGSHKITPKYYNLHFLYNKHDYKMISIIEMEAIKGKTLEKYLINKKKLNYNETKILQNKIEKLHKLNIVHGDLHAGNIMITTKNKKFDVFLVDLGFSSTKHNLFKRSKNLNYTYIKKKISIKDENKINNELQIITYSLYKNKKVSFIF